MLHGAVARVLWEERCRLVEVPEEEELAARGGVPRTVAERKPRSPTQMAARTVQSMEAMACARYTAVCRVDSEANEDKGARAFAHAWIETGLARLTGTQARPVALRRKPREWMQV